MTIQLLQAAFSDSRTRLSYCLPSFALRFDPESPQAWKPELEQAWPKKRPAYEQKLEHEGKEIRQARRYMGVVDGHPEHFRKLWQNEDQDRRQAKTSRGAQRPRSRPRWLEPMNGDC